MIRIEPDDYRRLACDECGEEAAREYHRNAFDSMIQDAKESGWRIRPEPDMPGTWGHTCPTCVKTSRLERARALFERQHVKPVREKRDLL